MSETEYKCTLCRENSTLNMVDDHDLNACGAVPICEECRE